MKPKYFEENTKKLSAKQKGVFDTLSKTEKDKIEGGMTNLAGIVVGPQVIKEENEQYIFGKSKENSYICLGLDRGLGAKGYIDATTVRIVAGHSGHKRLMAGYTEDDKNPKLRPPDIFTDSATLEIAQLANPDERLGLAEGTVGEADKISAIVGKADALRFIAENGMKFVTALSNVDSANNPHFTIKGIDFIAGNNTAGLQPIAKGDNTAAAIEELSDIVQNFIFYVMQIILYQGEANIANANHWHIDNTGGITPEIDPTINIKNTAAANQFANVVYGQLDNLVQRINKLNDSYTNNATSPKYIKSAYHNVT
jgi:hypothetical protein